MQLTLGLPGRLALFVFGVATDDGEVMGTKLP